MILLFISITSLILYLRYKPSIEINIDAEVLLHYNERRKSSFTGLAYNHRRTKKLFNIM